MTAKQTPEGVGGPGPGPWRVQPGDSVVHVLSDEGPIAATNTKPYYRRHDATDLANAQLIAAAPELLEALEGLVLAVNTEELAAAMACHSVASFSNVMDALDPALAALRKARGQ